MNSPLNALAAVRRDMERHLDAMRRPQSSHLRRNRALVVAEMHQAIGRMELALRAAKGGV
jgi:hypothetical protein